MFDYHIHRMRSLSLQLSQLSLKARVLIGIKRRSQRLQCTKKHFATHLYKNLVSLMKPYSTRQCHGIELGFGFRFFFLFPFAFAFAFTFGFAFAFAFGFVGRPGIA